MWTTLRRPRADGKIFGKNTIDLQWKIHANYNARLCAGFRKAAGAGNNGEQWKKQCSKQLELSEIRVGADVRLDARNMR